MTRWVSSRTDRPVDLAEFGGVYHLEPAALRASFAASCRRLRTDYLDIYFLHWPHSDVPVGPALAELEQLRAAGHIRAIGVSNFTLDELSEARQHATIDVLQPPYNMFWRQIEGGELEYCRRHGIGVVTYSGLAQGLLTGALTADTKLADGDMRAKTVMFRPPHYHACLQAVDQLRRIADRNGCSVVDIAINWLVSRDGVGCALLGARTVAEADANVAALGVDLPAADLALADACTREVWEGLQHYPDMFASWERMEIQRRRYELANRLPR